MVPIVAGKLVKMHAKREISIFNPACGLITMIATRCAKWGLVAVVVMWAGVVLKGLVQSHEKILVLDWGEFFITHWSNVTKIA